MTCDAGRPCQRCIQRKLDKTCQDAPRKRKKYLLDVPTQALGTYLGDQGLGSDTPYLDNNASDSLYSTHQPPPAPSQSDPQAMTANKYNPITSRVSQTAQFMSSAADMEYSTLSNILQDIPSTDSNPQSPALSPATARSYSGYTMAPFSSNNQRPPPQHHHTSLAPLVPLYEKHFKCDELINQYFLGESAGELTAPTTFPDVISAIDAMARADPAVMRERNNKLALSFAVGISLDDPDTYYKHQVYKEPEEIYQQVKQPFSYTPGYHMLIAYLRNRFPKPMLVKMAELMATYRPSFIACTNSLKEGDLIFMEQCFQRTLLTYDSFIRVSGTPTIVWRRTGEIAYVGHEFCILTGWSKEDLIGKDRRKFIVELLDDKLVVEYFQLFSRIAFGDFLGATMTECTLLTPKPDVKIRMGCIWTLKRDVFGIPMMIIGNFLPIL